MGYLGVANIFASRTSCKNIRLHPTGTESKKISDLQQLRRRRTEQYGNGSFIDLQSRLHRGVISLHHRVASLHHCIARLRQGVAMSK